MAGNTTQHPNVKQVNLPDNKSQSRKMSRPSSRKGKRS